MAANSNLTKAKNAKNDEFYTQLTDVAKEMMHYKEHFKDKIVLCNCDDPTWSAFWKYFHLNFAEKEADIVVTNPPFSLFREYVAVLMEHEKKFIIWGNNNAITHKEFFPLLRDNKVWLGYIANQTCIFRLSDEYAKWDEKITKQMNDGHKYGKCPAISVFTNLDIQKHHEKLILWKQYTPEEYPKYDNYDAINVDKISEIPVDYNGIMGVPITFLDKYNPEQFEIIGMAAGNSRATGLYGNVSYTQHSEDRGGCGVVNNIRQYVRILIRKKVGA